PVAPRRHPARRDAEHGLSAATAAPAGRAPHPHVVLEARHRRRQPALLHRRQPARARRRRRLQAPRGHRLRRVRRRAHVAGQSPLRQHLLARNPPMRRAALVVLWCIVAAVIVGEARTLKLEFAASLPWTNLKRLRKRPRPKIANHYREQILDDSLAEWKLDGPLYVALPPMYSDTEMGNAGFLSAFVNNGDVLLYNEPYPQPRLTIDEHMEGAPPDIAYHFDNRATNAALFTRIGGSMWPLGYTTWYDVVFAMTYADATTPRLIASDGTLVEPTAVRAIHPLNKVDIFGDVTRMEMRHLSPIVWTFPREGRLQRPLPGYVVESVADGAEVSYMPTLPLPHGHPFGMMLLAPRAAPTTTPAPRWWPV